MDSNLVPVGLGMRDHITAYQNVTDDGLPAIWTPEHVTQRLIEAQRVLRRAPWGGGHGGGGSGSAWPSLLIDMAKAVDHEMRAVMNVHILDKMEIARPDEIETPASFASDRPSPDQLSRMEEAMAWPMRFLEGKQLESDAITIYTYAKANRAFDIKPFFKERQRQAQILARRLAHDINASDAQRANREKRVKVAKAVNDDLNRAIEGITDRAEYDELKRLAIVALRDRCIAEDCMPVTVSLKEAAPGYCLWWSTLGRARKRAAGIIAKGLRKDRAVIR